MIDHVLALLLGTVLVIVLIATVIYFWPDKA